jgi:hypothetical protein
LFFVASHFLSTFHFLLHEFHILAARFTNVTALIAIACGSQARAFVVANVTVAHI